MGLDSVAATALLATLRRLGILRTRPARRLAAAALSRVHTGGDGFAIRVDAVNGERRAALALTGRAQSRATALVAAHVTRAALAGVLPAGVNHIDQLSALADLPEDLETHSIVVHDVPLGRPYPGHDGGSGIGLAVARAIIDVHKGRISAASDGPGTGAAFTILLPPAL